MRWRLTVLGVVQGVGFRPFVHALAHRHGLRGGVWNDAAGVVIDGLNLLERTLDDWTAFYRVMPDAVVVDRHPDYGSTRVGERWAAARGVAIVGAAGHQRVVLSGGCFQNALLLDACTRALSARGHAVLRPQVFPSNDGALSLGQAWVAAWST